jgi:hypothetical protein
MNRHSDLSVDIASRAGQAKPWRLVDFGFVPKDDLPKFRLGADSD